MMSLVPFEPCSSIWLSGQTGSGKTSLIYKFLLNVDKMYRHSPPVQILYCYGIYQELLAEMERTVGNFTCHHGLPTEEHLDDMTRDGQHRLLIIDDVMHAVVQNQNMELLFTQGCHHRKISVIFVTQNIFPKGKYARTIALNTWYMILMKNFRDMSQISVVGRQLFPGRTKGFMQAYKDALGKRDHGYLVVDMSPTGEDHRRLRTNIFPDEEPIIYQLK